MTLIKKHLISSWIIVLTLAIFVAAQQPPPAVSRPAAERPAPAATTIAPLQTPAPAASRPTATIAPQTALPTLSSTPVATPRAVAPVSTQPEPAQDQQANTVQSTRPVTAPAAREPEFVEEKGFKGKVFEVKHRDPAALARALQTLGSGFKGARISPSDEFKTITVRDFPENIAAMEDALKRLDMPQPSRPDIDFRIHVLVASNGPAPADDVPSELNEVVTQLKSTFKYKTYNLMFTSTHRAKESGGGVSNNGVVEPKLFNISVPPHNQIFFSYTLNRISLDQATGGATIQVGDFGFRLRIPLLIGAGNGNVQYENVGFSSPISLREGERVVVGTTTMGDRGLVVVLSAKSIK